MMIWVYSILVLQPLILVCSSASANPSFPCSVHGCSKVYTNAESLRSHMSTKHPSARPHKCHVCGEAFYAENYLLNHIESEHSHEAFLAHFTLHVPKDGEIRCTAHGCHAKFSRRDTLLNHIKRAHSSDTKSFEEAMKHQTLRRSDEPMTIPSHPSRPVPANNLAAVLPVQGVPSAVPVHSVAPKQSVVYVLNNKRFPGQSLVSGLSRQSTAKLRPSQPVLPNDLAAVLSEQGVPSTALVHSVAPKQSVVYVLKNKRVPGQSSVSVLPRQSTAKHGSGLPEVNVDGVSLQNPKRSSYVVGAAAPAQDLDDQLTRGSHHSQATCTCTIVPGGCPACLQNRGVSRDQNVHVIGNVGDRPQGSAPKRMRSIETSLTMSTQQTRIEPLLSAAGEPHPIGATDFWGNEDVYPPNDLSPVRSLQSDASAFAESSQGTRRSVNPTSSETSLGNGDWQFPVRSEPSSVEPLQLDASTTDNSRLNPADLRNPASSVSEDDSWITSFLENGDLSGVGNIDPLANLSSGFPLHPDVSLIDDYLEGKSDVFLDKHQSDLKR